MIPVTAVVYSGAHYGKSLFWYTTELLFGFYLAEIYLIPPSTIGVLLFVFLLWDAVTDPLLGLAISRNVVTTKKLLKYQFVGCVISSITFLFVFLKPNLSTDMLTIYAMTVGISFRTAYTVFDVPQNALFLRLTNNRRERLLLSSTRTALSAVATLTVSFATAVILRSDTIEARTSGFAISASIFVTIALFTAFLLYWRLKGSPAEVVWSHEVRESKIRWRKTLLSTELLRLFTAIFLLSIGWPLFAKLIPFLAAYVLLDAEYAGVLFATIAIATFVSQPVWIAFGNAHSRKVVLFTIVVLVAISAAQFYFFYLRGLFAVVIGVGAMAATTSAAGVIVWAMLADRLYEARLSEQNDVLAFGTFTFASKIGLGFGGLIFGWILELIEYQAAGTLTVNNRDKLVLVMAILPILTTALASTILVARKQTTSGS